MTMQTVPAPLDAIDTVWVDPSRLTPNPLNWKVHPKEQLDVVGALIDKHGWLKPFLFNRRTEKLVDGHARLEIAIKEGYPAVPVWVGDWSESEESEILVTLDESAKLSESDPGKLHQLAARIKNSTGPLSDLIARIRVETKVDEYLARTRLGSDTNRTLPTTAVPYEEVDLDAESPEPSLMVQDYVHAPVREQGLLTVPQSGTPDVVPAYNVRMVQLFLNSESIGRFRDMVGVLARHHGTTNDTETVMRCLELAHEDIRDETACSEGTT